MPFFLAFTCVSLLIIGAFKITTGLIRMVYYTLQLLWVTRIVSFPVAVLAGVWLAAMARQ